MSSVQSSPRRDDTSSRTIALLVRRYEADWRSATRFRPDPRDYLPDDIEQRLPVLTALLRADLVLGWRAHEPCPVEWYRARYPELDDESLLALIYEEYCLKEEAGESPTAAEYQARFPDVARSFQEVIEIHALVRRAGDPSSRARARMGLHSRRRANDCGVSARRGAGPRGICAGLSCRGAASGRPTRRPQGVAHRVS